MALKPGRWKWFSWGEIGFPYKIEPYIVQQNNTRATRVKLHRKDQELLESLNIDVSVLEDIGQRTGPQALTSLFRQAESNQERSQEE